MLYVSGVGASGAQLVDGVAGPDEVRRGGGGGVKVVTNQRWSCCCEIAPLTPYTAAAVGIPFCEGVLHVWVRCDAPLSYDGIHSGSADA